MTQVDMHDAKTGLFGLLRRVGAGEEVVITRSGKPVAKLIPVDGDPERAIGLDRGLFEVPDGFDDPLPEDLLADFER